MIKLDPKRPYGEVHGEEEASFEQDGILFRADGTVLENRLTDEQKAEIAKRAKRDAATRRAREALKTQFIDDGMDPDEAEAAIETAETTDDDTEAQAEGQPNGVDLIAWANGTAKYAWPSVVKALKDRYGFAATGKDGALQFMRDEGLI